ncbi:Transposase InsO and inactivated derivatives [Butyrivibrio proteoclasticus]|uniref:Transposase InsO and inactivated derivatives n=1 Tax=Butyrivibrio proteoclasticus TaxID=43305 RepID=A0A1I5YFZ8_9FIRM|nr:IS3 family transposase [Butyrivibrio proteoclasticus]SFQ36128.1 Transposase InsO and inactivated derivatives [Butyrivibrio proteoclasticus]SFQ43135.1 Transposase InsO and inactivated derivatives [Butyrivibrio proteoclasticus]
MGLSLIRHEQVYLAIKTEHDEHCYPISALCKIGNVSRAAYYKWLHRELPNYEAENKRIADEIEKIHTESPDKGYRRIRDELERYHDIKVNDKRVLRICRKKGIKSTIKYANNGCTRQAANPQFIAENILNREFSADAPNQKWLTDVTEFKYYVAQEVHKVYLSAILDLYDRRIVSYVIGDSNNNPLVFDTFDAAIAANPGATPLCHSDRGFQYTNRLFHAKLEAAGMTQSMSRVAKCIDNGPMEGFWGILKRERYYGKRFKDKDSLVSMIEEYIEYYNNRRLQRNLGVLTPMEKHNNYLMVA